MRDFDLKAVRFTAYGASFVYIDDKGKPLTPLYNYLKPYPDELKAAFYSKYVSARATPYCSIIDSHRTLPENKVHVKACKITKSDV
jgi:hypothetical protein